MTRTDGVIILAVVALLVMGVQFAIQGDLNSGPRPDRCEEAP